MVPMIRMLMATEELDELRPYFEAVRLEPKHFYVAARESPSYVYFPLQGLVSLRVGVLAGPWVQAVAVGRDGMLGVSAILEANDPPFEMVCLVASDAVRMPTARFAACAPRLPVFQLRLLRYAHGIFYEAVRTAACNGLHPIDQRLARCLLITRDRLGAETFSLTHEALAHMLGATRALLTGTITRLKAAGWIEHQRGVLRIADGAGLEQFVCEDYRAIQAYYARLLG
jgi:CRP-like cAMP-binding protein